MPFSFLAVIGLMVIVVGATLYYFTAYRKAAAAVVVIGALMFAFTMITLAFVALSNM